VSSPLMETSIDGARGVLVNITGSLDIGLEDVETAANLVQQAAHPDANIIFGATFDETMEDEIRVTVIATRFDDKPSASKTATPAERPTPVGLFTEAVEKKEAQEPKPETDPEQEEDPFDTIFKIFNSK
ncbi:MAG: cell division protein FtsZ, partial [Clostridiales bacterium]|nr:cell division protein FtsZ [Clostridiales bacterium]